MDPRAHPARHASRPIRVAIHGAAGRMGRRLVALASAEADLQVVAATDEPACPALGRDAGEHAGAGRLGVAIAATCSDAFDVMIDFSSPAGTAGALECCLAAGRALVTGTTGIGAELSSRIETAARRMAIVRSANMSVGVNLMLRIARELAAALGPAYDAEIIEAHHRTKADAPSGTAQSLLDAVRSTWAGGAAVTVVHGRHGPDSRRAAGEIGVHSVRLGDTVGEHTLLFGGPGETLSVHHSAHTRDIFVSGALRAARWIVGRPAGLYSMQDVLFG